MFRKEENSTWLSKDNLWITGLLQLVTYVAPIKKKDTVIRLAYSELTVDTNNVNWVHTDSVSICSYDYWDNDRSFSNFQNEQ